MLMKSKDCAVATALIVQGYLRANGEGSLGECLGAIRREVDDWAENLDQPVDADDGALPPKMVHVELSVSRTPYNLVSAAIAALAEAIDLAGPDSWDDFDARKIDELPAPGSDEAA